MVSSHILSLSLLARLWGIVAANHWLTNLIHSLCVCLFHWQALSSSLRAIPSFFFCCAFFSFFLCSPGYMCSGRDLDERWGTCLTQAVGNKERGGEQKGIREKACARNVFFLLFLLCYCLVWSWRWWWKKKGKKKSKATQSTGVGGVCVLFSLLS